MSPPTSLNLAPLPVSGVGPKECDLAGAKAAATAFLAALGVRLDTEHTRRTPERMARAYAELLRPRDFELTTFECDESYDGMVVLRGVGFASLCEHHALPFVGVADVGYLPGTLIVGLSKLARAVELFSRRPQVQERMTAEIADWLASQLKPKGLGVRVTAEHMCMSLRGARTVGATAVTSILRGDMRSDPALRQEWLSRIDGVGR